MSKLTRMGEASALKREEREFKLKCLLDKGDIRTVPSAARAMGLTSNTIRKYLKNMDIALFDPDKNDYTPGSKQLDLFTGKWV